MAAADLLTEIEAAISRTLVSQEYAIANRSQKNAMLKDLMAARRELLQEIQEGSSSGQWASVGTIDPAI